MTLLIIISIVLLGLSALIAANLFRILRSSRLWNVTSLLILSVSVLCIVILYNLYFNPFESRKTFAVLVLITSFLHLITVSCLPYMFKSLMTKQQIKEQEKIRKMYLYSPVGYQSLDRQGRIIDVNPAWSLITGYELDEVKGLFMVDLLTNKSKSDFYPKFEIAKEAGSFRSIFHEVKTKDKGIIKVEFEGNVEYDQDGRFIKTHCMIRDVTEQLLNEQVKELLTKTLEAKNIEMQDLVSFISHDLKTPVVNIRGFTDEIGKSMTAFKNIISKSKLEDVQISTLENLSKNINEGLEFIRTSSGKINKLIEGLSQLARIGKMELKLEALDMNELLANVVKGLKFQIRQSDAVIEIDRLPDCKGDYIAIYRIFSNLVGNSLKYCKPDQQCIIKINGDRKDGYSVYTIEDNGIGIEPENQFEIFKPFKRLNENAMSGEGLGLNIVQAIIARHKGNLTFESEKQLGTKFTVYLPW